MCCCPAPVPLISSDDNEVEYHTEAEAEFAKPRLDLHDTLAPIVLGATLAILAILGLFLAARAQDDYAYVSGFLFLGFSLLLAGRYAFFRRP